MSLLLNGAAILLVVTSIGIVARSAFVGEQIASCKERFASATRFSLESDGEPISAAKLQGELANTDWGLMSGARVVKVSSGPPGHVLELDLASAPSVSRDRSAERAGIGFEWAPQSFGSPHSACLSYSVLVPKGFAFGQGGRLPGLRGASTNESQGTTSSFSTRYMWSAKGELEVQAELPGERRSLGGNVGSFSLTPGKWTELEQEIVLNTAGRSDGTLRVWQDGSLVFEKKDVMFRAKPSVALAGVLAEVAAGEATTDAVQGSQKIWISPFELRWN